MTIHSMTYINSGDPARKITPDNHHTGIDFTIQNLGDYDVYLGGDLNTNSENFGYALAPKSAISFSLPTGDEIYAVAGNNGTLISTLGTGLVVGS